MNKLNILRAGDQYGWAYSRICQEHSRYSLHQLEYAKHDTVDLNNKDLLYIYSPDITNYHAEKLPLEARARGIKVIGGYAGNPAYWTTAEKQTYSFADLIVTISPQTYSFAKFHYSNLPVVFLPESIDTQFFIPKEKEQTSDMLIGWAGGAHKKIKRAHILNFLNEEVIIKDDWKALRQNKIQQDDLSSMRDFYNSIDVIISTSESECQPRVVMEAMAMGKPVICTDVGSIRLLLEPEWIVPVNPEPDVIKAFNEKLAILKANPELRKKVGERNREHIEKYWSWKNNSLLWDTVFSLVYENKIQDAIDCANSYLKIFKNEFKLGLTDLYSKSLILYNREKEIFK